MFYPFDIYKDKKVRVPKKSTNKNLNRLKRKVSSVNQITVYGPSQETGTIPSKAFNINNLFHQKITVQYTVHGKLLLSFLVDKTTLDLFLRVV
jgi:selenocysteine lyase/cysteine desulfurase